ncbi:hypothetical protein, partial [Bacteroides fragilis]|uniref:hypothetical protein n=1 Tax=Bacteroides fragilis TaxID=817 RepID=UPI001F3A4BF0
LSHYSFQLTKEKVYSTQIAIECHNDKAELYLKQVGNRNIYNGISQVCFLTVKYSRVILDLKICRSK